MENQYSNESDIVLGIYYLSQVNENEKPKGIFSSVEEIEQAPWK